MPKWPPQATGLTTCQEGPQTRGPRPLGEENTRSRPTDRAFRAFTTYFYHLFLSPAPPPHPPECLHVPFSGFHDACLPTVLPLRNQPPSFLSEPFSEETLHPTLKAVLRPGIPQALGTVSSCNSQSVVSVSPIHVNFPLVPRVPAGQRLSLPWTLALQSALHTGGQAGSFEEVNPS